MLIFQAMSRDLYSIRMHAQRNGAHLSGAERLVTADALEQAAAALVRRALTHPRGRAQSLRVNIDMVDETRLVRGHLPDVRTLLVADFHQGRQRAAQLLQRAGVGQAAVDMAMNTLARGAAPDRRSMRGAMLVGAQSARRYEPDASRGVRVSRMDLAVGVEGPLSTELARCGIDNMHVREALVLAAKVLAAPGILAELCWSDDPDYTTGYVAAPGLGYVRISELKPRGEERGGRAFFVREPVADLLALLDFLEHQVFLADGIGTVYPSEEPI